MKSNRQNEPWLKLTIDGFGVCLATEKIYCTWQGREIDLNGGASTVLAPEDAIAIGQALITLGTIAQNPTISKEETNEI